MTHSSSHRLSLPLIPGPSELEKCANVNDVRVDHESSPHRGRDRAWSMYSLSDGTTTLNGSTDSRLSTTSLAASLAYTLNDAAGDFFAWRKISALHARSTAAAAAGVMRRKVENAESIRSMHDVVVSLSSYLRTSKFKTRALRIRMDMLQACVRSNDWFSSDPQEFKGILMGFRNIEATADLLDATDIRRETEELRNELYLKIALGFPVHIDDGRMKALIEHVDFVTFLCYELAYGDGNYIIQHALECCASTPRGLSELERLDDAGHVVYDALRRLLYDFDNPYSHGVAFRTFGALAHQKPRARLRDLLTGERGIDALTSTMADCGGCGWYSTARRWTLESLFAAVLVAWRAGFAREVMGGSTCDLLVGILGDYKHPTSFFLGGHVTSLIPALLSRHVHKQVLSSVTAVSIIEDPYTHRVVDEM